MSRYESTFPPLTPPPSSQDDEHRKNSILNSMLDLFLDSVEVEIIQSVLESCNYDYEKCKEALRVIKSGNAPEKMPTPPVRENPLMPKRAEHNRLQHFSPKSWAPTNGQIDIHQPRSHTNSQTNAPEIFPQERPSPNSNQLFRSPSHSTPPDPVLQRIHEFIAEGNKIIVLLRGCSGSGKSYLANELLKLCGGQRSNHVFSSDDYFIKPNGKYVFNPRDLSRAHESNKDNVLRAVRSSHSPIIVDNTNTCAWEMQMYVTIAVNHGYAVELLEPQTTWRFSHSQLVRKNTHNVPPETIRMQLERYEHGLTGDGMIRQLRLKYPPSMQPPQRARKPGQRNVQPAKAQRQNAGFTLASETQYPNGPPLSCFYPYQQPKSPPGHLHNNANIFQSPSVPSSPSASPDLRMNSPDTSMAGTSQLDKAKYPNFNPFENALPRIFSSGDFNSRNSHFSDSPLNDMSLQKIAVGNLDTAEDNLVNDIESESLETIISPPKEFSNPQLLLDGNMEWQEIWTNTWKDSPGDAAPEVASASPKETQNIANDQRQRFLSTNDKDDDLSKIEISSELNQEGDASGTTETEAEDVCSWGLGNETGDSWETNLKREDEEKVSNELPQREDFCVEKSRQDCASNTNYQDFILMSNITRESEPPADTRVLKATSRDINENRVDYNPPIPRKIVVDVSTMTNDGVGAVEGSINELTRMFPHVSMGNLEALLESCQGDVNWASNCLLDTASGVRLDVAFATSSETPSAELRSPSVNLEDASRPTNTSPEMAPVSPPQFSVCEPGPDGAEWPVLSRKYRSCPSIDVRSFGNGTPPVRRCSSVPSLHLKPLSPQTALVDEVTTKANSPPPIESPVREEQKSPTREPDESETSSQDDDEMLEFVISQELSQQLFCRFGGPQNKLRNSGLSPLLRIPESIARQIHYYMVLSQEDYCDEEDDNVYEDKNTSKEQQECKIDRHFYEEMCAQTPLSKQEQDDMELATAIYELDLACISNSKDTVATVLARKLLQENFPKLDPHLLAELMEVQGNSFHRTKQMIQEHFMNGYTMQQADFPELSKRSSANGSKNRSNISEKVRLKSEAEKELEMVRIFEQKAKEQNAKREWSAAAVYSQMAMVHKRQHNKNMELTVARVMADNLQLCCPSSLDLHFLLVEEALLCLDHFLDEHILSLADQPNKVKSLYIITGRGKHSSGGVPKIRPAVLERLNERSIENTLENPGLVRVEVTGHSDLSYDC